jgi:serine protease inhibitor
MFYDDEDVKVIAKDLKTYDGTTLQYVGIMPKKESLETYIDNIEANDLNKVIGGLKSIELDSFEDGYVTIVEGYIPMFKFDYELKLMDDLKELGIEDVFDVEKSDLSNLSSSSSFIDTAVHKANIEFSNDGIKASAATAMGGMGAADGGFKYYFEAPVKRINLTFDNPYMYLVRDKDTGEIWFAGTVYEPVEFVTQGYGY